MQGVWVLQLQELSQTLLDDDEHDNVCVPSAQRLRNEASDPFLPFWSMLPSRMHKYFKMDVGDGWAKGKVVDLQFKEPGMPPGMVAPYQVELEDDGGLIYAPNDSNEVIRKPWRFFDAAPFGG